MEKLNRCLPLFLVPYLVSSFGISRTMRRSHGGGTLRHNFPERAHLFGENDPNHRPTILQTITNRRIEDVAEAKSQVPIEDLKAKAAELDSLYGPPLDLKARVSSAAKGIRGMGLAAEFKRASPSKGDIAVHLDAAEQGVKYAEVGAAVISVLTEKHWFKGSLEDMYAVRVSTQKSVSLSKGESNERPAVLRKDFIVDVYQVWEARAFGADTLLLIVAILEVSQLVELISACRQVGMEPLVEVHTDEELDIALECGAKVIGVNNRNLHTFKLNLETTERHARRVLALAASHSDGGEKPMILALSGISNSADVDRYRSLGVEGVLVGEALMRAPNPQAAIEDLLGGAGRSSAGRPLVKVCGITDPDDALAACRSGASLIGVIFAPKSKRKVSIAQAKAVVDLVRAFGERGTPKRVVADVTPGDGQESVSQRLVAGAASLRAASSRTPLVVGVFQDQSPDEVKEIATKTGVDLVQFHGDESDDDICAVGLPSIRVLHLPPDIASNDAEPSLSKTRAASLASSLEAEGVPRPHVVAVLLDTATAAESGGERGGTGVAFDWHTAFELGVTHGIPVLVAGGLTPNTVGELTGAASKSDTGLGGPLLVGVDASSALELDGQPGIKDLEKVKSFVCAARGGVRES